MTGRTAHAAADRAAHTTAGRTAHATAGRTARAAAGRVVRAGAAVLLAAVAGLALPAPARAAGTTGYCPDATGVTVVVDFHELGGGVVVRCAPGAQASGLTALQDAGFTVAGTNRWGLAFICRISGKPAPATEPCVDTPPATAYWSYWHAPNGGAWAYSQMGVKNRTPPQGSFDGWSFAKNRTEGNWPVPGAAPSRPAPPPPPATSQPAQPGQPRPAPTTAATTGGGPATGTPSAGPAPSSVDTSASPGSTAPPSMSVQPDAGDTAPPDVEATGSASGVPVGTIAGAAVLALLAAVGGYTAWRRRTGEDT
ncbi:hypothetical protein [Dactylosporangium sp. NPDC005555]|uniref:hypothetical protein n=1 Tax=Dactylosporangium sp. NPDC005555 TaxID=3154889 RepID=UPI0033B3DC7F